MGNFVQNQFQIIDTQIKVMIWRQDNAMNRIIQEN